MSKIIIVGTGIPSSHETGRWYSDAEIGMLTTQAIAETEARIVERLRSIDIQSASNCDAGDRVVRVIESKIDELAKELQPQSDSLNDGRGEG